MIVICDNTKHFEKNHKYTHPRYCLSLYTESLYSPGDLFQGPLARDRKNNCHHHIHVLTVRDHIVRVLVDRVVVDIDIVVVVIVDVVIDVCHSVQRKENKCHEVE